MGGEETKINCPLSNTSQNNGFTLLELLVAMALLVILSGALYGTYFSLMNGRESAVSGMEARRELRTTLDMLRREIASAYFKPQSNSQGNRLCFVVEDRDFFGKPASTLHFTAIAPPSGDPQPHSDLMDLTYKPVEKDNNKIVLTREAHDFYYLNVKPYPYPQMEELEGFLVECQGTGGKWVRTWDTNAALNSGLPKAVRITLQVKDGEKIVEYTATVKTRIVP